MSEQVALGLGAVALEAPVRFLELPELPLDPEDRAPDEDGGPRCTPTVDGDRVYAIGTSGDLVCLNAADGGVRWRKSFEKDFGGAMMSGWRYSESPLIDGEKLVPGRRLPAGRMRAARTQLLPRAFLEFNSFSTVS